MIAGRQGAVLAALVAAAFARGADQPALLFHAPFDGSPDAAVAGGSPRPVRAEGATFGEGHRGRALRVGPGVRLDYPFAGNAVAERGTVSFWAKGAPGAAFDWQYMFAFADDGRARGSGAVGFWWFGNVLRGDVRDLDDTYVNKTVNGRLHWHHYALTWDEHGPAIWVDGRKTVRRNDSWSPLSEVLSGLRTLRFSRVPFERFCVGQREGRMAFDGWIDDLRVYDAPLADEEIVRQWRSEVRPEDTEPPPDYAKLFAGAQTNRWEGATGVFPADGDWKPALDFFAEVKADPNAGPDRFRRTDAVSTGVCTGVRYVEAAPRAEARFGVRVPLPPGRELCCVEVDYPDDKLRTMDILLQLCGERTPVQVGVAAGGEYANTGRILTHRCLLWTSGRAKDLCVVAMTARDGEPAAISAVRVFSVRDGRLPRLPVPEAPAAKDGWRRSFALYFEDPGLGWTLPVENEGTTPAGISDLIDRTAAMMKYNGQNLLMYPGCWYHGLVETGYQSRSHAPDFLSAWYAKFDREGLGFVPTVGNHNVDLPDATVTKEMMGNGVLHASPYAIHETGRPNWGEWHCTPPNFCIAHPEVRRKLEAEFDALLVQGKGHPSFKGVCLHLTRHVIWWWGDLASGYNDYAVDAFAQATGVKVPVDRADPLRGKVYAAWLKANAYEKWVQWRCDVVTEFWTSLTRKLAEARPDLRLWVNCFTTSLVDLPGWERPDYIARLAREAGVDAAALAAKCPNLILSQCIVPGDFRWRGQSLTRRSPELAARQLKLTSDARTYDLLTAAAFPWVGQHDRYFETDVGSRTVRGPNSISCDWVNELPWRASTINPAGVHARRAFVEPLRFHDVLGMAKGGCLFGMYGEENALAPFVRAYRALPAVVFEDRSSPHPDVRVRAKDFAGRKWCYAVNVSERPVEVRPNLPPGSLDLVSGEPAPETLTLGPYELRSFATEEKPWRVLPIFGGGYVQGVAFCASDTNRLYSYVDVGGPYRSDDRGGTWRPLHGNMSLSLRERQIDLVRGLSVDPRAADRLVVVGGDGASPKGGVAVTADGGRTWRQTLSACFYGNGRRRMLGRVLDRDPFDPDRLVAGEDWDGLFVSGDGGETWRKTGPERHWFTDVRFDRKVRGRVYASAPPVEPWLLQNWQFTPEMRQTPRLTGFYRSDDGGETWRKVGDEAPDEIVQIAGEPMLVGTFDRRFVRQSEDGGVTWLMFEEGLPPAAKAGMPLQCKGHRYALGAGRGFWVLGDAAGYFFRRAPGEWTWTALPQSACQPGNPVSEPWLAARQKRGERLDMPALGSVAVDPCDDAHWFATDWFDLWESRDAGTNWTSRVNGMMQLCSFTVEADPFDRKTLAYGVADLGSFVSNDGGRTFESKDPCYWSSIAFSKRTPGLVMACGGKCTREINVSRDHGRTWKAVAAKGLPDWSWGKIAPHGVHTVAVRPDRDEFWICVGGSVAPGKGGPYKSTDGGESWVWSGEGLPTDERIFVYDRNEWEIRTVPQQVFSSDGSAVTTSSFGRGDYYRLAPGESAWRKTDGRRDGWDRHSLAADPFVPGRYVAGGRRPLESTDGGATWHPLTGLRERADFVSFDPFVKGLVVAAGERDIFVSRNGGRSFDVFESGYPLPAGRSRHLVVFDGRLYFLTGGSGVFVKEIGK